MSKARVIEVMDELKADWLQAKVGYVGYAKDTRKD